MKKFQSRDHLVVPVVALKEGVVWPSNAAAPEYVTAECLAIAPQTWNGRPLMPNHPVDSANERELLEREAFGAVLNSSYENKKLLMEAWIDIEKCKALGGLAEKVLKRAQRSEAIEVSVGAYVVLENKKGEFNGKPYSAMWQVAIPDHLAMLPEGVTGACSNAMGCGAPRSARLHTLSDGADITICCSHESDEKDEITNRSLKERLKALLTFTRRDNQGEISDVDFRNKMRELTDGIEPSSLDTDDGAEAKHSSCGCGDPRTAQEKEMEKGARVKALIAKKTNKFTDADEARLLALSEDVLKVLEDGQVDEAPAEKPVEGAPAEKKVDVPPVPPTPQPTGLSAQQIQDAVKEALGGLDLAGAKSVIDAHNLQRNTRKSQLVGHLKGLDSVKKVYDEARLNTMSVESLEELALLTQNTAAPSSQTSMPSTQFVIPAQRSNAGGDGVPEPPDMVGNIRKNAQKATIQ